MFTRVKLLGGSVLLALAVAVPILAGPADAQTRCGPRVTVGLGDTLYRIAARCGTTAAAILRMNPQIENPNVIHLGQVIHLVPGQVARPVPPKVPGGASAHTYVVRPGDTLYRISVYVGVPLPALIAANPHIDPRFLRPGMIIRLPGRVVPSPYPQPLPPRPQTIAVSGIISDGGATCPVMRGNNGRLYSLVGDFGRVRPGDRVRVEGRTTQASICMQGTTIQVHRLRIRGGDDTDDDADQLITVTGRVTDEGVECTAIRGNDGRLYTLAGRTGGLMPGDRVEVIGRRAEASFCMQGTTIEVVRLRRLG